MSGPLNRPLEQNIIEKPHIVIANPDSSHREPDELDPMFSKQEATTEYYRQRNCMIYRELFPLDAEGNQQGRNVGRFMAARHGRK